MPSFALRTDAGSLEHSPSVNVTGFSLTRAMTRGVKTVIGKHTVSLSKLSDTSGVSRTLPDGRLKVGISLPLLARRFRYLRLIGEGTSAQVILAEDTYSSEAKLVVIKVLKRHFGAEGLKEIRAIRFLQAKDNACPSGLVQLSSAFTYYGHVCLVLERLHGSLLDYMVYSARLHRSEALHNFRKIALQLLGALALMHSKGVVHADIKPENILLTNPLDKGTVGVRVIDLGNCFSLTGTDTSRISFEMQTLPFRAPEALVGGACGTGIDVWSLGCVLAEVALQRPLFPVTTPSELVKQMTAQLGPLPSSLPPHPSTQASATPASGIDAAPSTQNAAHRSQQSVQTDSRAQGQHATSITAQAGVLTLWHERASPLHLELAKVDPSMASLVTSMLKYDPQTRISAAQALRHPFLRGLSPILQLPQPKAQGAAELPDQASAKHAAELGRVGQTDLQAAEGQLGHKLPLRPEPRRQPVVNLPTGGSAAQGPATVPWTLPLPSDPILRAPEPQLGLSQSALPPKLGVWLPPSGQKAQQWSPPKPDRSKLEGQMRPAHHPPLPQLGQSHRRSPSKPAAAAAPCLISTAKQQSSRALSPHIVRPSTCEAAQQAQHAEQTCEGAAPPGLSPSAVHSPARAATAQPSSGVDSLLPGPHVTAVAGALTTLGDSPATAAANQLPCPPTAGVAGNEATTAGIQSTIVGSGPIQAGQSISHSRLQTLKALPSGIAQGLDTPARMSSNLTGRQNPGETPQVTVPSLDQLPQGAMQTPGVVKAWNGVAQLLQHMTPASEVRPPPPSLTQALMAAGAPPQPHTTPPTQPFLSHGQPATHVKAEQQQQQQQQENVSSQQQQQQAASHQDTPAGVAMDDGAQAGQAAANLPSWISPEAKQADSSQQESHVSASHVSQSIDSSESHGLAALQEVSDEQQSRQEHVTGSHMESDQARSQVANQTLPHQSELQGADKPRYATSPAEPDQDMPAGDLHKVVMSAGKLTSATSTKPDQAMPAVEPKQAMSLDEPRQDMLAAQLSQDVSAGKPNQKLSGEARAHALEPTGAVSSPDLVTKAPPQGRRRRFRKASTQVQPQQLRQTEQRLLYEGEAELRQQPGKQPRQRQAAQQQQQQQVTQLVDCMLDGMQQPNQLSRAGSRETSAVPVESQQSAVHALAHDPQIQSAQAQKKKAQQSAVHALAHDSQTQSAQAHKQKAQDCEPNASASGTEASPDNKMISKRLQRGTSAVDKLDSGGKTRQHRRQQPPGASCADRTPAEAAGQVDPAPKLTHQLRRNHEGDLANRHQPEAYDDAMHGQGSEPIPEGRTTFADAREHVGALRQSGKRPTGTSSTDQAAAAAGTAAPAAKRHRRSRESDANKPWWVV